MSCKIKEQRKRGEKRRELKRESRSIKAEMITDGDENTKKSKDSIPKTTTTTPLYQCEFNQTNT